MEITDSTMVLAQYLRICSTLRMLFTGTFCTLITICIIFFVVFISLHIYSTLLGCVTHYNES